MRQDRIVPGRVTTDSYHRLIAGGERPTCGSLLEKTGRGGLVTVQLQGRRAQYRYGNKYEGD